MLTLSKAYIFSKENFMKKIQTFFISVLGTYRK